MLQLMFVTIVETQEVRVWLGERLNGRQPHAARCRREERRQLIGWAAWASLSRVVSDAELSQPMLRQFDAQLPSQPPTSTAPTQLVRKSSIYAETDDTCELLTTWLDQCVSTLAISHRTVSLCRVFWPRRRLTRPSSAVSARSAQWSQSWPA